ncbi:MAG: ferredoxin family protein [Aquamicrobium sp.]|jgi:ferredoxin|uniref:ferredoxin n=1 Tax=Aquamicrobium sp. TaxID=1872579 RepID=UPI00349E7F7E|nr:ferredoxin family protein [Aquamicrobium sp.]MCO5155514.1 ferredoxin family protein [Aquamicrobium sp.]
MPYVIGSACIDVKDGACQDVCPVECIYEGGRMMYIHPTECISCGICLSVCPVDAIFADDELPERENRFLAINAEFFEDGVTGWGEPGGASETFRTDLDHPEVAGVEKKETELS